jgi:hypothetical protein
MFVTLFALLNRIQYEHSLCWLMLINIHHLISTGVSWSKANIKGQPVGLITVKSFNSNTRDDVMHALEELHKYVTD